MAEAALLAAFANFGLLVLAGFFASFGAPNGVILALYGLALLAVSIRAQRMTLTERRDEPDRATPSIAIRAAWIWVAITFAHALVVTGQLT